MPINDHFRPNQIACYTPYMLLVAIYVASINYVSTLTNPSNTLQVGLLTSNSPDTYRVITSDKPSHTIYLHHNIPLDCTVHHTPSGYMYRYGWLKAMTQFSNICSASSFNNQILFFYGHDSHFYDRSLTQMQMKIV